MDELLLTEMADLLRIAGDPTRLKIMLFLLGNSIDEIKAAPRHCHFQGEEETLERSVNQIAEATQSSQSLVSHQLKILKDADLVATRKQGRQVFYRLSDGHVKELVEVVLEHVLEKEKE